MSNTNSSKKTVARKTEAPARSVRRATAEAPLAAAVEVDGDQVAALAYKYFVEGGYEHGHALEHWLRAEADLRGE